MTDQDAKKKANAERQREYKARHKENSGRRLDIQVSLDCLSHLRLLAKAYNETKKEKAKNNIKVKKGIKKKI